jgi:hypothetical protein
LRGINRRLLETPAMTAEIMAMFATSTRSWA